MGVDPVAGWGDPPGFRFPHMIIHKFTAVRKISPGCRLYVVHKQNDMTARMCRESPVMSGQMVNKRMWRNVEVFCWVCGPAGGSTPVGNAGYYSLSKAFCSDLIAFAHCSLRVGAALDNSSFLGEGCFSVWKCSPNCFYLNVPNSQLFLKQITSLIVE